MVFSSDSFASEGCGANYEAFSSKNSDARGVIEIVKNSKEK